MYSYKDFVKANYSKIHGNEKIMWECVDNLSDMLDDMPKEEYWEFMRDQHEIVSGKHFDEVYAKWQVSQMEHKDSEGKVRRGEHWTLEDTDAVYAQNKSKIPAEYNRYDFYVALNSQYHDYIEWVKKNFPDKDETEIIVSSAITFWMKDEDWGDTTKVWDYFRCKPQKKEAI